MGSALIYKRSLCITRIYGNKLHVNYGLWWTSAAVTDVLPFAGDGLKFTFDLPLPGKRVSRKSPNPRKVRTKTFVVNIQVIFSCQRVWQHDLLCGCKRNSRLCPILVCSDRGNSRLPGESKLRVIRPGGRGQPRSAEAVRGRRLLLLSAASWCSLIWDSVCSVLTMPSGALFVHLSHVMRELLDTERIYVEELLSVLLVRGEIKQIPVVYKADLLILCLHKWFIPVTEGIQSWDGEPSSVGPSASHPPQQARHPLWKHAWDLQFSQPVTSYITYASA